jgi:hypothetical protein
LCGQIAFQKFLKEKFPDSWREAMEDVSDLSEDYGQDAAADAVRAMCHVKTRADIKPNNTEWLGLMLAYQLWQHHPELEDV